MKCVGIEVNNHIFNTQKKKRNEKDRKHSTSLSVFSSLDLYHVVIFTTMMEDQTISMNGMGKGITGCSLYSLHSI